MKINRFKMNFFFYLFDFYFEEILYTLDHPKRDWIWKKKNYLDFLHQWQSKFLYNPYSPMFGLDNRSLVYHILATNVFLKKKRFCFFFLKKILIYFFLCITYWSPKCMEPILFLSHQQVLHPSFFIFVFLFFNPKKKKNKEKKNRLNFYATPLWMMIFRNIKIVF